MYADQLMYWASIENPAIEMASLDGTGRVTLLNESKAVYTGITLYNNYLYISDASRRSLFCIISATLLMILALRPLAVYHTLLLGRLEAELI